MKKFVLVALCFAFLSATAGPAKADPIIYSAILTGSAEFEPNDSSGIGVAFVTYDAGTLGVQTVFGFLTGTTTASHIHCCVDPPGAAGVATTVPTFPGFPLGETFGMYQNTFDLTDPGSFNPAFLTANGGSPLAAEMVLAEGLASGRAYFNIHTTEFPAGEIRGFLTAVSGPSAVPEPNSLVLLGTGLLGAAGIRRWRRRKG